MVQQWKEYWQSVRRPCSKWYEKRDSSFNVEVRKCREFLVDPQKQRDEYHARITLLDLHRNISMENQICKS
jgi:hypothetical protein